MVDEPAQQPPTQPTQPPEEKPANETVQPEQPSPVETQIPTEQPAPENPPSSEISPSETQPIPETPPPTPQEPQPTEQPKPEKQRPEEVKRPEEKPIEEPPEPEIKLVDIEEKIQERLKLEQDERRKLANKARAKKKEDNLNRILEFSKDKRIFSNDDIRDLLHVSQSTATNYLSELTKRGSIKREGKRGGAKYSV